MAGASMLVHVTHIDDSVRGRQNPCIFFWGITQDRSSYLLMEQKIEDIRIYLEARSPPLNLDLLDRVCCVLINHKWHRARVTQSKLSHAGTIEVICIDSGDTHAVTLAFVRTLDIPGTKAEHVRECPPLASKFILADIVAPPGRKSGSHWSEQAMSFLKLNVLGRTWKATSMGLCNGIEALRLFNCENQLLALIMIEEDLGVASPNEASPESINDVGVESLPDTTANAIPVTESSSLVVISESSHLNSNIVPSICSKLDKSVPRQVKTIPRAWLASKVWLYVIAAGKPGLFFGLREEMTATDLDVMTSELMLAYSSEPKPPLLYADCKSHLGQYGVVDWGRRERFYRIRVTKEFDNYVECRFIDLGPCHKISKTKIFTPLKNLKCFRNPPFGIYCMIEDVKLSDAEWGKLIYEKNISVKITKRVKDVYSVTLTEDTCNQEISKAIYLKTSPTSTNSELTNETTWISAGRIESSSGPFTVEMLSPESSHMTNIPSTSGGQKPEALQYADSRVEESTDNEFYDEKRKKKYARRNAKGKAIKIAKLVQVRSNTTHEVLELVPNPRKRKSEDGVESTGQGKRQPK